ncbi:hypothetical protein MO973_05445 [Paenibacillus sp. TRM 82003]|nr:hypothetical protein [Paenibacillus sp. TRM 82003]
METGQSDALAKLTRMHEDVLDTTVQYWQTYSHWGTWQFWALAGMIVLPLAALYFLIDRRKALLVGFFGFNVHAWFHYADLFFVSRGLITYPYKLFPWLPSSISLDTAFVPVTFMLLYQWALQRNRPFFVYGVAYSAFLSFLFKPFMALLGLIRLNPGTHYVHLFMGYVVVLSVSLALTRLFLYLKDHPDPGKRRPPAETPTRGPFASRLKAR